MAEAKRIVPFTLPPVREIDLVEAVDFYLPRLELRVTNRGYVLRHAAEHERNRERQWACATRSEIQARQL